MQSRFAVYVYCMYRQSWMYHFQLIYHSLGDV